MNTIRLIAFVEWHPDNPNPIYRLMEDTSAGGDLAGSRWRAITGDMAPSIRVLAEAAEAFLHLDWVRHLLSERGSQFVMCLHGLDLPTIKYTPPAGLVALREFAVDEEKVFTSVFLVQWNKEQ